MNRMDRNNIYLRLWASILKSYFKNKEVILGGLARLWFLFTFVHALNLWLIFIWLNILGIIDKELPRLAVFNDEFLDMTSSFLIVFYLPIGIINYCFVFMEKNYIKILDKNENVSTKLFLNYWVTICVLTFITLLILQFFPLT